MFRTLIITSALALAATAGTIVPASANTAVFNYPGDPCRTAAFNAAQAQWQESHTTDKGNLGGAAGYDELADQAQKSADRATAQAKNLRQAAKDNPKSADFWNKQADEADSNAKDWQKSAEKYRDEAQKMRDEGKDYSDAAKKALLDCLPLVALEPQAMQVKLAVIARDIEKTYGDSLDEPAKAEEPAPEEKKPAKKVSSNDNPPPQQDDDNGPKFYVSLPHLYIEDGEIDIWDGWHDEHIHDDRHHRRHVDDHDWTDGDRDELPKIGKDHKLSKIGKEKKFGKEGHKGKLMNMGENRSIEKIGKNRKLGKQGKGNGMGQLVQQSKGSDRKLGKMMGGKNKMMGGGKRKRKLQGMGLGL